MQIKFLFSLLGLAICLKLVVSETANLSPNGILRREKRLFAAAKAAIKALTTGADIVNTVKDIFKVGKSIFDEVVSGLGNMDASQSSMVNARLQEAMKEMKDDMKEEEKNRMDAMMEATTISGTACVATGSMTVTFITLTVTYFTL